MCLSRLPSAARTPSGTTSREVASCGSSWSDSTWSVFVSGSQTIWLIPTVAQEKQPTRQRNTVELETVDTSIGPLNGTEMRGWTLKPSSRFSTARSAQSDGVQPAVGRLTRRLVVCVASKTVCRLDGNGCSASTPAACASGGASSVPAATSSASRRKSECTGGTLLFGSYGK